ncbi:MAG: FUSC family protein [Acidobacteria bacterium]|nr:FUSC family protein [Acidobacteriota bacterium]MDW7985092.1 hypothetical protein [Acidobacteriota bacterium]
MRGFPKALVVGGLIVFSLFFIALGIWALRHIGWQPKLMSDAWWPQETVLALEIPRLSAWIRAMEASPAQRDIRRPELWPELQEYFRSVQAWADARLPAVWQARIDEWAARGRLTQVGRVAAAVWVHAPEACRQDKSSWEWAWMVEAPPAVWSGIEPGLRDLWREWMRFLGADVSPVVHTDGTRHFITSARGWGDLAAVRTGRRPALRGTLAAAAWRRQVRSPGAYLLLVPRGLAACLPTWTGGPQVEEVLRRIRAVTLSSSIRGGWQDTVLQVWPEGPWPAPWDRLITRTAIHKEFFRWVQDEDRIVVVLHVEDPAEWIRYIRRTLRSVRDGPLPTGDDGLLENWSGDLLITANLTQLWPQWPRLSESALSQGHTGVSLGMLSQVLKSLDQARLKVLVGAQDAARWKQALEAWVEQARRGRGLVSVTQVRDRPFPLYQATALFLPTVSPTFGVHPVGFVFTLHGAHMDEVLEGRGLTKGGLLKGKPRWRVLDTFGPDRWMLFLYLDGPSFLALERPLEFRPVGTLPGSTPDPSFPVLSARLWSDLLRRAETWQGQLTKAWCDPAACNLQSRSDVILLPPPPVLLRLTALALRDTVETWRARNGRSP